MKKILSALLCMSIVSYTFAYDFSQDGLYYEIIPNQTDVAVVKCPKGESYSGDIVVPDKVTYEDKTYNVTYIGNNAFRKSSITSITLPEGLQVIGTASFRECQELKSVTIPSTVISIWREAFIFCFSLSDVTFKSKELPSIGSCAFGKTLVKKDGIDTGIPGNMAVPEKDSRYKIKGGFVTY